MDVNIAEYEKQLYTVDQALQVTQSADERQALEALRSDLLELLALTKQTSAAEAAASIETHQLEDELEKFKHELAQLEGADAGEEASRECQDDDLETKLHNLKKNLEQMLGQKCSAPHQHSWGAISYHNAIVCGADDAVDVATDGTLNANIRVLFTNPTHREMLPCAYYLEGECRFSDAQCHYSHGELVSVDDLRSYSEPDFTRLARNCAVLAKLDDRLWHRGRVLCANFIEKLCRIRLDGKDYKQRELDLDFENLFPIFYDEEELSSGSSDDTDSANDDSETLNDLEAAKHTQLVGRSLFEFQPTQPLGDWEKHTRGIGSKLMAKMGYVHGTGLGSEGRGIVTPVSAQILPQGCSLDHCMALREAANGDKDLFSVEKKLRQKQKHQETINTQAYERESRRVDVFSFLNENVFGTEAADGSKRNVNKRAVTALHEHSTKALNVESVRIADEIRRKEREIAKVQESLQRNTSSGSDVHKRLLQQLQIKTQELNALQREETSLCKEQATRKTKNKLCVF